MFLSSRKTVKKKTHICKSRIFGLALLLFFFVFTSSAIFGLVYIVAQFGVCHVCNTKVRHTWAWCNITSGWFRKTYPPYAPWVAKVRHVLFPNVSAAKPIKQPGGE